MKCYIAGPMSGLPDYNFPEFHKAARQWRSYGYEVVSPAERHGGDQTLPYRHYIEASIDDVRTVDVVALLPGWEFSKGARMERAIAEALGIQICDAVTAETLVEASA